MRWEIINKIKSYLEIGQQKGQNFREIKIDNKEGVDPKPKNSLGVDCKYKMTSDDFFKLAFNEKKLYDIIFIDGLHIKEQVIKDVENSLKILNNNGVIILHDCKPENEYQQITSKNKADRKDRIKARGPNKSGMWTGDVWKAFLKLRMTREDLKMYTIDTDCGCGIIQFGHQELFKSNVEDVFTWEFFNKNKEKILNLISVEEFNELLNKDLL
jgi:hypothetical protein